MKVGLQEEVMISPWLFNQIDDEEVNARVLKRSKNSVRDLVTENRGQLLADDMVLMAYLCVKLQKLASEFGRV